MYYRWATKSLHEWQGHRSQEIENSRQYLRLRTDILQKTVFGCPWHFRDTALFYCLGCGGFLNKTSGVLYKANGGYEAEKHCIWKIGKAGVRDAVAIFTFETIYLRNCR